MKLWQAILVGAAVLLVLYYVVGVVFGTLVSLVVAGGVCALVGAVVIGWVRQKRLPAPPRKLAELRKQRQAQRALDELKKGG